MPRNRPQRQSRLGAGNRRHLQVYVDAELHGAVTALARREGVSFSRAARQLLERGAEAVFFSISNDTNEQTHGH